MLVETAIWFRVDHIEPEQTVLLAGRQKPKSSAPWITAKNDWLTYSVFEVQRGLKSSELNRIPIWSHSLIVHGLQQM
jgi:hypothetical protein